MPERNRIYSNSGPGIDLMDTANNQLPAPHLRVGDQQRRSDTGQR